MRNDLLTDSLNKKRRVKEGGMTARNIYLGWDRATRVAGLLHTHGIAFVPAHVVGWYVHNIEAVLRFQGKDEVANLLLELFEEDC